MSIAGHIFALSLFLVQVGSRGAGVERADVNLDYVAKVAEQRAHEPFRSPRADMPDILKQDKLDYDKYRKIRFKSEQALWSADRLPFRVEFFHPGYIYQEPVRIFEFSKTHVQQVRFVQDWFDYTDLKIEKDIPVETGYAGFKLLHSLNKPAQLDELASFLGASYFRMLGKNQRYGASARGLALDCGEPDRPEEFPIFTDFWLGKPQGDSGSVTLYSVLDAPSCTGAYEFLIQPGETTVATISAVLFFREEEKIRAVSKDRKPLATLGMAPLSSMCWFGENSERKFDDYRPEVHDSDGLLMHMDGGEVVWRPLNNALKMHHSVFAAPNVRGFGLLQRDREFSHYSEIFNLYHKTPSAWIKPKGDWGEGEVHLVELSTNYEGLDNIVAFWNPLQKPAPLQPFSFSYELLWTRETDFQLSANHVVSTRIGAELHDAKKRQVHIDFDGPELDAIPEQEPPKAIVSSGENARIYEAQVLRNAFEGTWRVMLKFEPKEGNTEPVDIRCTLQKADKPVSETWVYLWSPP